MKKNKKTIPTIIGLVTLIIGMATGVLLVKNRQLFKLGAEPELNPKDIRVSNISDSSFTVSWTTSKEVQGFVVWGTSQGSLNKTALSATGSENYIHSVTLEKLLPETPYFFKINSGGYEFDNENIPWQTKTGPKLPSPPLSNLISGSVLTSSGSPAAKVMVYTTVGGSSLLSTLTSEEGTWIIPISNARDQNLISPVSIDETSTLVEISVQGGPLGVASAQIYPKSATPAPPIILGGTHNFKTVSPSVDNEIPAATVDLPEESTPSSGFNVPDEIPTPASTTALTPTDSLGVSVQCQKIMAYDTKWELLTENDLANLKEGDKVRFAISCTASSGILDKAKFSINGEVTTEVTDKKPDTDEFYYKYTTKSIDIGSTIKVYGWVHNASINKWF